MTDSLVITVGLGAFDDRVELRWQEPFGAGDFANTMEFDLGRLRGVEDARVSKYSAELIIATHVTSAIALIPIVADYFAQDRVVKEISAILQLGHSATIEVVAAHRI